MSDALRARGVSELEAALAARTGMVVFVRATIAWLDDPSVSFTSQVDRAACELKTLFAEAD